MKKYIYFSCSLTHVPEREFDEYMGFINTVSSKLLINGHSVKSALTVKIDPKIPKINNSRDCYLTYRGIIEVADLVIAEVTHPSTGVGIELQIAANNDIPVIVLYNKNISGGNSKKYRKGEGTLEFIQGKGGISAMLEGLPNICDVIPYQTSSNVVGEILNSINKQNFSKLGKG